MASGGKSSKSVFGGGGSSRRNYLDVLQKPIVQFVAFGLFVILVVLIMTAGFDLRTGSYRNYVVGQVAPHDIKATRDFSFTAKDVAASRERREEVALNVPPVFDWQEGAAEKLRDNISRAFGAMREGMARVIIERLQEDNPEQLERLGDNGVSEVPPQRLITLLEPRERLALSRELRPELFTTHFDSPFPENAFATFARDGFSAETENALTAIVSDVMSRVIVRSESLVSPERTRGIFLRRLRGDKLLIEYHVTDVGQRFRTADELPKLVSAAAEQRLAGMEDGEWRRAIISAATALVGPNTTLNAEKTAEKKEAARDAVSDLVVREEFRKGQVIVDKGHIITERHLRIIQRMQEEEVYLNRTQAFAGVVLFSLLFLVTLFVFGRRNIKKFDPTTRDVVFMATVMALMLLIARLGITFSRAIAEQFQFVPAEAWFFAIPVAMGGMLIRLVLNSEHAVVFTVLYAVLCGVMADNSLFFMSYAVVGGLVGAGTVKQVKNRMALMWSGLVVGVVNVAIIVAFLLIEGDIFGVETPLYALLGFGGGVLSGFMTSAMLPVFETGFGYTTDIKLLELANLNHPALRELIMRAPGSYHHSMMVGSLCEAAAERIGCNPLLSRVGAYYHDIGKAKNPQYFAENQQQGKNPHDNLKPNMSALIIKKHVKDGLEMAKEHRLPEVIQDFIAQHHGTSLIAYFYHKAKQLEDPDIPEVDEKDYRYPGPRPQTRETAICLLADGVEAASRAMPDPSHARLKGLVQKMINNAFTDGQLDDCDLTLKDLNEIAQAFTRILTGIYHHRPEYPTERETEKIERAPEKSRQEPGRKQKSTGERRRKNPAPDEEPTTEIVPEDEADDGSSQSDTSSDVWEITAEKVQKTEEDLNHAGRHQRSGKDEDSSEGQSSEDEDRGEERSSLPRLGSE